jgi:restriction system protein
VNPEWEQRKTGEAEEKTTAVEQQIKALDDILAGALQLPPWSFDRLVAAAREPRFDPGPLGRALPAPAWEDFAPERPSGLRRLFGGRYKSRLATARARYDSAQADHEHAESERQQAIAAARARHHQEITQERSRAAKRNAFVTRRRSAFAAGDPEAVEWFVGGVLTASRYPDGFPRQHQVVYRPQSREVAVEFEFPPQDVVPAVRGYRYLVTRDTIEPLSRPASEISKRHRRLIAGITLRTLHEIFAATPPDAVAAVAFDGRVTTVAPATGKPTRQHLLSVSVTRPAFEDLVLAAVDPLVCLEHLNAQLAEPSSR